MSWMHRVRLRVLALIVGVVFTAIGVISFAAMPVWPVIGVAVAAVAVAFSSVTARLTHTVCWGCGKDITSQPLGEYGAACPHCGAVNQPLASDDSETLDRDDAEA